MLALAIAGARSPKRWVYPVDGRLPVAVVHPAHQAERPHVLAADGFLVGDADVGDGGQRHLLDVDLDGDVIIERSVLERVRPEARLGDVAVGEGIGVEHDGAALGHVAKMHLERRRVHRHQNVRRIARRHDVVGREVDLEPDTP